MILRLAPLLVAAALLASGCSTQRAGDAAPDQSRIPTRTLQFFGLRPDMTVVEAWPGSGWYTEILAPLLESRAVVRRESRSRSERILPPDRG